MSTQGQTRTRLAHPEPIRLPEIGRLRFGVQVPVLNKDGSPRMKNGAVVTRPNSITTWRLTSGSVEALADAARLWGGEPRPWEDGPEGQYELITTSAEIQALLPNMSSEAVWSQAYEIWSGGGIVRRCDTATCTVARKVQGKDGESVVLEDVACLCDPLDRECDLHTRVNLILGDLPGLGVWRLDTSSRIAASHLPTMIEMLLSMGAGQHLIPVVLRLDRRRGKRQGISTEFVVPVIDVAVRAKDLGPGRNVLGALEGPAVEPEAPLAATVEPEPELEFIPEDEVVQEPDEDEGNASPNGQDRLPIDTGEGADEGPSLELQAAMAGSMNSMSAGEKIALRGLVQGRGVKWSIKDVCARWGERARDLPKLGEYLAGGGE